MVMDVQSWVKKAKGECKIWIQIWKLKKKIQFHFFVYNRPLSQGSHFVSGDLKNFVYAPAARQRSIIFWWLDTLTFEQKERNLDWNK